MVSQATEQLKGQRIIRYSEQKGQTANAVLAEPFIRYYQSPAEDLTFLENDSVDFVAAGSHPSFEHTTIFSDDS